MLQKLHVCSVSNRILFGPLNFLFWFPACVKSRSQCVHSSAATCHKADTFLCQGRRQALHRCQLACNIQADTHTHWHTHTHTQRHTHACVFKHWYIHTHTHTHTHTMCTHTHTHTLNYTYNVTPNWILKHMTAFGRTLNRVFHVTIIWLIDWLTDCVFLCVCMYACVCVCVCVWLG